MTEFRSITAETGAPYGDPFPVHGPQDVAAACAAAEDAFETYRATSREARAAFLERCGEEIIALGDALIENAMRESGLPRARLEGERGRTVGQLRMFADVVRKGWWQQLRIDPAMPERQPLPRPDLRLRMIPVGPVAVFGASNFPLAFSTAGGDTASALAAGCPVVVKGHPAHPATAALVAQAMSAAVKACGLPDGVFSQITGPSHELGAALVQDPRIAAVGFTGSRAGGLALLRLAQAREVPIPVYAEMSSINPVLLLPEALKARGGALGTAFVGSLTMGAGQFCTNPGLLLALEGDGLDAFVASATEGVKAAQPQTMLTAGIREAYLKGVEAFASHAEVETLATGAPGEGTCGGTSLFQTTAKAFLADPNLANEVFGASGLLVRCTSEDEMIALIRALEGQLTATLHMDTGDEPLAARLLPLLERKVGRILANGWPTGVEVSHAMVHGGPFPATSDGRTTSVGSLAIDRFLRPVSYQNLAQSVLPEPLRDNALGDGTPRIYDGAMLAGR
ncbi:MAG: aldehyde dehydrogenase (NADP(+)) [Alphaproteobacteria bacterium]|nr:aldehyde dehydrogenase (NADP(+)) [Alphaproteobacteria bacterium]MBU0794382.1 aldehyde dehydrogenase (NADP(+)) [Alphaproteobacteria bacterium]MBU0874441.1 aldehyde dehydrogenase (NADP(+)) [Alphaproteobacteria bacterium]MBU1768514.1 aldehyde dehydrogenase (NADP(+)) [Alphaproteobacteria bacterium]